MARSISCPNCGAQHTLANPGVHLLICSNCQTVVYWDDPAVLQMGQRSVLPEGDHRLFQDATGTLAGRGFRVMGRLRYDHGSGTWDEWYLQYDDGSTVWLSEDERKLSLEHERTSDGPLPPADRLTAGESVSFDGIDWSVLEKGVATCVGGEGQMDRLLLPGDRYPYADLISLDGEHFATLEYEADGQPTCYLGQDLTHEALVIEGEAAPTGISHAGGSFDCTNCGSKLEQPSGRDVEILVCPYCDTHLDLTDGERRILGRNPPELDPAFVLEVGQAGTFLGHPYEVAGRMYYEERDDTGAVYPAREYLLWNPDKGYLWLEEEKGHYLLNRPTREVPRLTPFGQRPKSFVEVGDTRFLYYEEGFTALLYVDGSLPWIARVGDRYEYCDCIAPPEAFCIERGAEEVEYFRGRYHSAEEIQEAFGLAEALPRARGVHRAQPAPPPNTYVTALAVWGIVFGILNLFALIGLSTVQPSKTIFTHTFGSDIYAEPQVSDAFELPEGPVFDVEINASVNNSWTYAQVLLLNEAEEVVGDYEHGVEYYHGVEGGESWSEGSRTRSRRFLSPGPGRYRISLKGECANSSGPPPPASSGFRGRPPPGTSAACPGMDVKISAGSAATEWLIGGIFLCGGLGLLALGLRLFRGSSHENNRWGPVMDDEDDGPGGAAGALLDLLDD